MSKSQSLEEKVKNQKLELAKLNESQKRLIELYATIPNQALHDIVKMGERAEPLTLAYNMKKVAEDALEKARDEYKRRGHWPADWGWEGF